MLWVGGTAFAACREQERPQLFFFLMLIAETATLGSFLAQDLLLFVLFFDFMLVPFYFLFGSWGKDREGGPTAAADGAARTSPRRVSLMATMTSASSVHTSPKAIGRRSHAYERCFERMELILASGRTQLPKYDCLKGLGYDGSHSLQRTRLRRAVDLWR